MINYELAKKLKDNGFIQRKWRYAFHYIPQVNEQGEQMIIAYELFKGNEDDLVYIPQLVELIEACGDGFDNLTKMSRSYKEALFTCNQNDDRANEGLGKRWYSDGNTPEEAVALLWLQLNKKHD